MMPKSKLPPFQRARQPKQIEQRQEAILQAALALFQKIGSEWLLTTSKAAAWWRFSSIS
jgi:hypothetical protein